MAPALDLLVSEDHTSGLSISAFSGIVLGGVAVSLLLRSQLAQRPASANSLGAALSFQSVAQAVPAILWTARADGSLDFLSEQLYRYSGFNRREAQDWGWSRALHPDDLAACLDRWRHCIVTGEGHEIEYPFRRSDGIYRWFIVRANPVRDEGGQVIEWIGTCTYIEVEKRNQQILEQQIKERTEELAEANTRLQQEIRERDVARRQLVQQTDKDDA